jgi:hypothetical protein
MNDNHLLCWNVHGLNSRARRNVIRTVVTQQRASVVCVQESKIENFYVSMNLEITGFDFDYISLPAIGIAGGAVTSWRRDIWAASNQSMHRFFYHGAPYPPCAAQAILGGSATTVGRATSPGLQLQPCWLSTSGYGTQSSSCNCPRTRRIALFGSGPPPVTTPPPRHTGRSSSAWRPFREHRSSGRPSSPKGQPAVDGGAAPTAWASTRRNVCTL